MTILHPITRAAHIQINSGIAPIGSHPGAVGELLRIITAQLQDKGRFLGVKPQQPLAVTVNYGGCCQHFGIEQALATDLAQHKAPMPIRTI